MSLRFFNVEDYWHIFTYHLNVAIDTYVPLKRKTTHINNKKRIHPKKRRQMLNRKSHYWRRWRRTKDAGNQRAYKAYSVKCTKAIQAYYHELETTPIQADDIGKFYQYVNGRISACKEIPPIKDASGVLVTD